MRTNPISLLICAVLLAGVASQAATPKPSTLAYEVKMKSLSLGDMGTRKMYVKGNKMRWEGKVDKFPMLVIKNSKGAFLILPWQKIAAKYPKDSDRNNPASYLPGPHGSPKAFLAQMKAKKSGQEKIDKQMCNVYSYRSKAVDRDCKLWISVKTGKPVKLLLVGEKKRKDTIVATYTKFVEGGSVSDSLFELPKDHAIRDMPKRDVASADTSNKNTREPI